MNTRPPYESGEIYTTSGVQPAPDFELKAMLVCEGRYHIWHKWAKPAKGDLDETSN